MIVLKLAAVVSGFVLFVFLLDRLGLWLEARGFLYYRRRKRIGQGVTNAFLDAQRFAEPTKQHVIRMRDQRESPVHREPTDT